MPFTFRCGVNMNIYCKCPGCTTLPSIFSSFSAKTINQFKDDTTKKISIPSIAAGATNLILKFIVGSYGTQRSKYIERVTVEVKSSSSSDLDRKLNIVFVQSSQIAIQDSNPSFFPQIPKDMFYPIFFMSWSVFILCLWYELKIYVNGHHCFLTGVLLPPPVVERPTAVLKLS